MQTHTFSSIKIFKHWNYAQTSFFLRSSSFLFFSSLICARRCFFLSSSAFSSLLSDMMPQLWTEKIADICVPEKGKQTKVVTLTKLDKGVILFCMSRPSCLVTLQIKTIKNSVSTDQGDRWQLMLSASGPPEGYCRNEPMCRLAILFVIQEPCSWVIFFFLNHGC